MIKYILTMICQRVPLHQVSTYKKFRFRVVKCPNCGRLTFDNYHICYHCNNEYDYDYYRRSNED